jgi:predicted MFS family arabinose efflux permease
MAMPAQVHHKAKARLHHTAARYRAARRSLHAPASWQSRYGLDWTNFFIADVQTGFGTYVAFYLAGLGWSHGNIGLVLTVGGIAGVVSQIPGGALADAVTWKRALVATASL